ncbi:hypothetical protein V8E53_005047 [Lactarius tabidus]
MQIVYMGAAIGLDLHSLSPWPSCLLNPTSCLVKPRGTRNGYLGEMDTVPVRRRHQSRHRSYWIPSSLLVYLYPCAQMGISCRGGLRSLNPCCMLALLLSNAVLMNLGGAIIQS